MSDSLDAAETADATHDRDGDGIDDRLETVLAAALGIALVPVARRLTSGAWRAVTGRPAPEGNDDDWQVALLWGAVAGAGVGVARAIAGRQARAIARRRRA